MHEYSVVQSFLEMCDQYVKENQCQRVVSAKVKTGVLSGIELSLFKHALESFKEGSVLEDAQIEFVIQPLRISCADCGVVQDCKTFVCPSCQGQNVKAIDGEEFVLLSLEME